MRGCAVALAQLTNLRSLNVYGSCIAPAAAGGGSGAVCQVLTQLQQLTFLSLGCVHRSVMTVSIEDAAHLSALTNLQQLHLHGAQLGVGLDQVDSRLLTRLEFLKPLSGLTSLRLWSCRFTHVENQQLCRYMEGNLLPTIKLKRNSIIDRRRYPDEKQPDADYSGDEGEGESGGRALKAAAVSEGANGVD